MRGGPPRELLLSPLSSFECEKTSGALPQIVNLPSPLPPSAISKRDKLFFFATFLPAPKNKVLVIFHSCIPDKPRRCAAAMAAWPPAAAFIIVLTKVESQARERVLIGFITNKRARPCEAKKENGRFFNSLKKIRVALSSLSRKKALEFNPLFYSSRVSFFF